jgi:predicted ATPase
MSQFTLTVRNLRGLRHVEWSPAGVNALIGPNGAGKSTVFLALKLLRTAIDRGLPEAVALVLGGSEGLKHRDAEADEPVVLEVQLGGSRWSVHLRSRGPTVDALTDELLEVEGRLLFRRDALGNFEVGGERWAADDRLGLRAVLDGQHAAPEVVRMAAFLRSIAVFHDLDPYHLRREGSHTAQTRHLHSRGHNALAMLRRWSQERPDRWRYVAVVEALKAAFPGIIGDLDFQEAGVTVVARVYPPGSELPVPLSHESNGLISLLISMCALVSVDEGGVVAIDEAGDAMHPMALRVFLRQAEQIARQRQLTVLLASHNTVVIDHFTGSPERVFALRLGDAPAPVALRQLKDPRWLEQFRLGELYSDGEFGTNDVTVA